MKLSFFSVLMLGALQLFAQEFSLKGKVVDTNSSPLAYANVVLLTASDSTVVTGASTDDNGTFIFNNVGKADYILNIRYLGYVEKNVNITVEGDTDTGVHIIDESTETLNEINIIAEKPTLKREADRLTFSVANTSLIEGSMLQVLRSTPSLLVINGNIQIKNQTVDVYINNRKINLSTTELTEFLENAPANSIKSVEVITNPPASYDASSGSVVNIVMDKNMLPGYRGTVATKYTQGVFPRYNASTSHFFRGKKSGLNFTYSYTKNKINRDNDDVVNYFNENNEIDRIFSSDINRNTWSENHTLNLNYDYNFNENNTIILTATGLYVPYFKYNIINQTDITDENGEFIRSFTADNLSRDDKYNVSVDLDYVHKLSKGKITLSGHTTLYDYNRFQIVESDFFNNNMELEEESLFNTDNNQETKIYSGKIDYALPINETSNFETGLKFSNILTDSDVTQLDVINGQEIINPNNTNAFDYDEKIYAAYVNYSKDWEKWNLSLGLRTEHTDLVGISDSDDNSNTQDYLEWFPNFSLLHQISDGFNVYVNYDRSISRPNFQLLNPFQIFLNENTIVTGNPNLQPIFTDHAIVGATLFENFTLEAYYSKSQNNIYELPRQDNAANNIVFTPLNVDETIDYGFDMAWQNSLTDYWYLYLVTSFYNSSDKLTIDNNLVELDRWANYSQIYSSLSLLKDKSLSIELSATYSSKSIINLQTLDDQVFSSLSISKKLLNDKATLSLSAGDLFNMEDPRSITRYLNQFNIYDTDLDTRFISLNFRYRFGNTGLRTNEKTISTEERDRLEKK